MENNLYYIELSNSPIRFDAVSQLTNVFFDDSNKQIFAVRSGGATGVVVKGPTEETVISYCMDDKGIIRSIKFSPDNRVLAVQRKENIVEFICFNDGQPGDIIPNMAKSSFVHGFVWIHNRECALISNSGIEIFSINPEKKQIKSIKCLTMNIKWFAWCSEGNLALISSTENSTLTPVIIKQKTITKLPKLDLHSSIQDVPERDVTLGIVYGTRTILILQQTPNRLVEVVVYLLNGPGLAPTKSHILRLGHSGRFAMNIIDNLIIVHHQASATSLLFDISLSGEINDGLPYHSPVTPGRTIKPFLLKLPSLSPDGQTMKCDLYSKHWVLFQPNIVIDAIVGCMWYLSLKIEPLCHLITDRIRLVEFLLQRNNGRKILIKVLQQLVDDQYNGTLLPILEIIFNKINQAYKNSIEVEFQTQSNSLLSTKSAPKLLTPPKVLIDQIDMLKEVFTPIIERPYTENILILYLQSLAKHNINAQEDLSKMILSELIKNRHFNILQRLVEYSLILESKAIACFLLSHSNVHPTITQTALDILKKIKADEIIIEVLLGQGKVIDALRLAKDLQLPEPLSARKYLEAAQNQNDPIIFYTVFKFFQQRNLRSRGSLDFLKTEQCNDFVNHFNQLFITQ